MDKAYVTVLTTTDYLPGVKALKRSLIKVHSKYELFVLIPKNSKEIKESLLKSGLIDDYCHLIEHENIPDELINDEKANNHYWWNTFFKLTCSDLTQFKKIIMLDSDMLIMKNIDLLFEKPHYSATRGGNTVHPDWILLNSGLMVIEPSHDFYNKLLNLIKETIRKRHKLNYDAGDQDVFHAAYPGWEKNENVILPEIFGVPFCDLNIFMRIRKIKFKEVFVVHFTGYPKPWMHIISKNNFKTIARCIIKRKFSELFVFLKYIRYARF